MENERRGLSVEQALKTIEGLKHEMLATGSVDSETGFILSICDALQNGKLTPEDAVNKVTSMLESRQSYH